MIALVAKAPGFVAQRWRGIAACAVAAAAASFLADHYKAPVMLMALLFGMALAPVAGDDRFADGVSFSARTLLRLGVALLGAKITLAQILGLGTGPIALAAGAVVATILASVGLARLFGFNPLFGVLTGGATAICGASAALALSAALPAHAMKDRATTFTVVGISLLSTAAMVLYPLLATRLGLSQHQAGLFIGGSIHDVAQVIGAGYSLSPEVGDIATVMKLVRVGMLGPVVIITGLVFRERGATVSGRREPLVPWFVVAFVVVVGLSSLGVIPPPAREALAHLSRGCLILAIAALGMRTSVADIVKVGPRPFALLLIETALLAGLILGGVMLL